MRAARPLTSGALLAGGALLLTLAALISNAAIERVVLGEASGALSWGPTLLRLMWAGQGSALLAAGIFTAQRGFVVSKTGPARRAFAANTDWNAWRTWSLLAALSVVAMALRLWRLNSCLWFDEAVTLVHYVRLPFGRILSTLSTLNQHMLFSVLAHASISIFGESAWAVRLPAVLLGVAGVWALFGLARGIIGSREALLACALMTVSYHHVWFSQDARGYTGLMLLATLATWLWLEALRREAWAWFLAYAVAVALGMWMHLTMAFVPAAHVVLSAGQLILMSRRAGVRAAVTAAARSKPLAAWLLAGSLALEFHALALPDLFRTAMRPPPPSEWTSPAWLVTEALRGLGLGFGQVAVVVCGLGLALAGWLHVARRDGMAAAAMVLPAALAPPTIMVLHQGMFPRFFFFSFGFGVLIAVHGVMTVARALGSRVRSGDAGAFAGEVAGVLAVGGLIVLSALSLPRCYAFPKQDFAGARDYVERTRQADDAAVAVGLAGEAFRVYFAPQWAVAQTREELEAITRTHRPVWLVYTLPIHLKTFHRDLWETIQRDFRVVRIFPGTLGDGAVNVCRERAADDGTPP